MVTPTRTGGVSIVPLENGCIVLRAVGVTIYSQAHVPLALEHIREECDLPPHLVQRITESPSVLNLSRQ